MIKTAFCMMDESIMNLSQLYNTLNICIDDIFESYSI